MVVPLTGFLTGGAAGRGKAVDLSFLPRSSSLVDVDVEVEEEPEDVDEDEDALSDLCRLTGAFADGGSLLARLASPARLASDFLLDTLSDGRGSDPEPLLGVFLTFGFATIGASLVIGAANVLALYCHQHQPALDHLTARETHVDEESSVSSITDDDLPPLI